MKRIVTIVICIAFILNLITPGFYAWASSTNHQGAAKKNAAPAAKTTKKFLIAQTNTGNSSAESDKQTTPRKKKRFFGDNTVAVETTAPAVSASPVASSTPAPVKKQAVVVQKTAPAEKKAIPVTGEATKTVKKESTPAKKAAVIQKTPVSTTVPNITADKKPAETKQVASTKATDSTPTAVPVKKPVAQQKKEKPAAKAQPVETVEAAEATVASAAPAVVTRETTAAPVKVAQATPAAPAATPTATPAETPAPVATPAIEATPAPAESPAPAATPASPAPETSPAPAASPAPGGEREETARITSIEVRGNNTVPSSEILSVIRSKVGDPFLEPRIRSDQQAIYETGYFTDVSIGTQYYAGGYKLVFRVQENPIVTKITILGNKIVPLEKLRSLMQTREGKILNMKTLSADMNEINYYYSESLGYKLDPTHFKNVNWTPQGELILTIQEGLEITEVRVTGSSLYQEDRLRQLIQTKPGQLFNEKQITEDANRLTKFYEDEGYIPDTVRPIIDYRTGVVTLQVIEAVVEDIRIEFDKEKHKTKEQTVLRNIRTKPGEVLQRNKLQRDIERLNNLGYFSRVNVDPEPGSKPGNVVLVFRLQEQKTGLATIGVGYTGGGSGALRSGITGAISFSEKNLSGTGQALSASWQRGVNIDALNASYYNPAINKNQDSFTLSIFRHNYTELLQPVPNTSATNPKYALYDDIRTGGSATFGRRITDDFRLFLTYRHESLEIRENSKSQYTPIGISKGTLSSLGLGALYDDRNDVFDPTYGTFVDATVAKAGDWLGGTYKFWRYQAEVRKYIPIGRKKRSTIALRAWGGLIKGNAPVTEVYYVGGTDTVRGYPENAFFGTRMAVLNAEYRFPLGNIKYLKGAVFADAGNAWFPGQSGKLYTDAGAGLRIVFPTLGLGVIRVDFAVGENRTRTSIGIGQTF